MTTNSTPSDSNSNASEARPNAANSDHGHGVVAFDPATDPAAVTLSPAAARHLGSNLAANAASAVRLGVTESGCNGYMYELSYAEAIDGNDHRYEFPLPESSGSGTALTLVVSRQDLPLVQGTQVDYVTEGLNSALRFTNPNADTHCGCGESFSVSSPDEA